MVVKHHGSPDSRITGDSCLDRVVPINSREERAAQRREIAGRIRAHVAERKAEDPDYSVRKLSLSCGWDGSHLGTVLRRLEAGKDVRAETLRTIAMTIGRPVAWLETGTMPEGVLLKDCPGWKEAASAALAASRTLDPAAVEAVGHMRVPAPPRHLTGYVVAQMARAWMEAS